MSHVTLLKYEQGYQLETLISFGEACERLMQEESCSYQDIPKVIARKAKCAGLSASRRDFTCSIDVQQRDPLVEELLLISDGKKPEAEAVRQCLEHKSLPTREQVIEELLTRCITTIGRRVTEATRGEQRAAPLVCQYPPCNKMKR